VNIPFSSPPIGNPVCGGSVLGKVLRGGSPSLSSVPPVDRQNSFSHAYASNLQLSFSAEARFPTWLRVPHRSPKLWPGPLSLPFSSFIASSWARWMIDDGVHASFKMGFVGVFMLSAGESAELSPVRDVSHICLDPLANGPDVSKPLTSYTFLALFVSPPWRHRSFSLPSVWAYFCPPLGLAAAVGICAGICCRRSQLFWSSGLSKLPEPAPAPQPPPPPPPPPQPNPPKKHFF